MVYKTFYNKQGLCLVIKIVFELHPVNILNSSLKFHADFINTIFYTPKKSSSYFTIQEHLFCTIICDTNCVLNLQS